MRMWNVNPKLLCTKHLLGEHVEMHMFKGSILKHKSIEGFLNNKLVNIGEIKLRHDKLVKEMKRRGMNHKSDMDKFDEGEKINTVNIIDNLKELKKRCKECRRLQDE